MSRKTKEITYPDEKAIRNVAERIEANEFWDYIRFADIMTRFVEITMKKDKLSPLQAVAMCHLAIEGGVLTPTRLAKLTYRSKHSMTKVIDSLEKEGLIIREYSDKDRRVTYIRPTYAGLEYVERNFRMGSERALIVTECLNKEEKKKLVELTDRMNENMTGFLDSILK